MGFFSWLGFLPPAKAPPRHPKPLFVLRLIPGKEIFTPAPLPIQRIKVTISGMYLYNGSRPKAGRSAWFYGYADACYDARDTGNFLKSYQGLHINGQAVQPFEEDRDLHSYTFGITATGQKLSFLLVPPPLFSGLTTVNFRPLDVTIESMSDEDAHRAELLQAEQQAKEQARREAAMQPRLNELTVTYEHCPHYADQDWLRRHAIRNRQDLLESRDRIMAGNTQFHSDPDFIAFLKRKSPDTYERALWESRALAIVEQHYESHEDYRQRHDDLSRQALEDELTIEEEAIKQAVIKKQRLNQLRDRLIAEGYSETIVNEAISTHLKTNNHGGSHVSPDASSAPPEVY